MAGDLAEQISQKTSGLIQSSNHRDLLDVVDSLRSHGVSHYVDLPQIIVCGSQSSGKSSTLESLSGIAFPTAEGLCTRFATELILRRGTKPEIRVHIQPGVGRSEEDRRRLSAFSRTSDQKDFPRIIEAAKAAMGLTGDGAKVYSTDVLRIESTSPTAPNLTLVDLPGLFGASDKNQSDDDAALVQKLVTDYMHQKRSIILAVVTADNPFANQPVTKFARDIDPTGVRTLGLITKPDKIERGSDSEKYYVELAQNQNVKLNLGWHVLRNKGHTTMDDTAEERDAREAAFFEDSVWNTLDPSQLGVNTLRTRLRKILWKQIQQGLPGVKSDVQSGIKDCNQKLTQLGKARSTRKEKHTYLQRISSRLSVLVRAAIDGVYSDLFFESYPGQQDAFERRLRANVQKILTDYAEKMRVDGHALEIVEDYCDPNTKSRLMKGLVRPSLHCLRQDLKDKVDEFLKPHLTVHPITYNDWLVRKVQEVQEERHNRNFDLLSQQLCAATAETAPESKQIALKKFIDDVSVNAIETCLIQRLPDVFSPDVVWDLSDEQVEQLGSEDDGTVKEREDLVKKLRTLEKGLMDLDAFTARSGAQDVF
ncbi:hypothetical protein DL766_000532 [Monosporascus sp. MC13-8B]|uniref:GED domain-containing protein n=1 Tax=Monosporascus cannonballus TaxID=155416 RepID=A0ABY0H2B4_9PEZI|nr:hypothetical protein DL762_007866 [Monosporascus cannonballus]RYO82797.1 hypothetical protein DL763_008111 [Monosporascus cannonballus]RYP39162.1 hypothetical protein DL766_000532 [Monosporascus sp. MC13-8B]